MMNTFLWASRLVTAGIGGILAMCFMVRLANTVPSEPDWLAIKIGISSIIFFLFSLINQSAKAGK